MNVLIVYAHPEPTSFCAALRDRAVGTIRAAGHEVTVSDLYRDGFDPVAGRHDFTTVADPDRFHYQSEQLLAAREGGFSDEIRREQDRVRQADLFIIIYPIWWGGPPAIFKGWLDRVLAYGFAYEDGQRFETGFFRGRRGLIGMATGGTPQRFSRDGAYGDIDQVMWPTRRLALEYMGLCVEPPFVCYAVPRITQAEREGYLDAWADAVRELLAKGPVAETAPIASPPAGDVGPVPQAGTPAAWARA
ncbi:MAG: flavodoxin family protein [Enterovirga sp.]|nr:flavodoxin family protein [Enterovirga sp.]